MTKLDCTSSESADKEEPAYAVVLQSLTKKGDLHPKGMLVHWDWKKDPVGMLGLSFATSLCTLSQGEHPFSLERLAAQDGAWRYMPVMSNAQSKTNPGGALDEKSLRDMTNVSKTAKEHLKALRGIQRSLPLTYTVLEKGLSADFHTLGIEAKDVNQKKLHWFRLISVWISELDGVESDSELSRYMSPDPSCHRTPHATPRAQDLVPVPSLVPPPAPPPVIPAVPRQVWH